MVEGCVVEKVTNRRLKTNRTRLCGMNSTEDLRSPNSPSRCDKVRPATTSRSWRSVAHRVVMKMGLWEIHI